MTPPEPQEAQPPTTRPRAGPRFGPFGWCTVATNEHTHARAVPCPPAVVVGDRGWYRLRPGRWHTAPGPPYGI